MIHEPFYSDALRGWRIENDENNESIVVYTEAQAWLCFQLATGKGWKAATNQERAINLEHIAEEARQRKAAQQQQLDKPQ